MNRTKISGCCLTLLAALQWGTMRAQSGDMALIEGKITINHASTAYLYKAYEGNMVEVAQQMISDKGSFAFALPDVKEGFYYVGTNVYVKSMVTRIYLKPGEHIGIQITDSSYSETALSEEAKVLNDWQQLSYNVMKTGVEFWSDHYGYVKFFPALEALLPKAEAFKQSIHTHNPAFDDYMRWLVDNDIEYAAISLLYTPRVAHSSKEERPDYYSHIAQPGKYASGRVLQLADGYRRASFYGQFICMEQHKPGDKMEDYNKCLLTSLENDTLRGYVVLNMVRGYKSLEGAEEGMAPYQKYLVTDSLRAQYTRSLSALATFKKGEKAFEFNFKDNTGKMVSLKDFRGKVVYIDTWATWCGPCKGELPSLRKLEESYKNDSRIAFVSISIDEEKDTQKWVDFVREQELGGAQLHTPGWNSDFIKYYKINGIPRFLLIDQDGNLVTADAPRPSSGDEINNLLKKTIEKPKS